MPSLLVRNLDESIVNALKARALANQRSAEAEHRAILAEVLIALPRRSFAQTLSGRMPAIGIDADFECLGEDRMRSEPV